MKLADAAAGANSAGVSMPERQVRFLVGDDLLQPGVSPCSSFSRMASSALIPPYWFRYR
jgi:hypothetical protein